MSRGAPDLGYNDAMVYRSARLWLFSMLVSNALAPAQTFIVDAANGPGTSYTSITAATMAAPSGSTLLVRPALYEGFEVVGKSMTILCDPGVYLYTSSLSPWGALSVRNVAANQAVVIRGLVIGALAGDGGTISGCAGAVLIEDVADYRAYNLQTRSASWSVANSQQVLFRNVVAIQSHFSGSDVVLESCTFRADGGNCGFGGCVTATPGLQVWGGTLQIVDSAIVGGAGIWQYNSFPAQPNYPAIRLSGAALRVLAPCTLRSGNYLNAAPVEVIDGTGSVRIDPAAALVTTAVPPIAMTLALQSLAMPALRTYSASPGGTLRAEALGPVGSLVILVVGLPGPATFVPGVADPIWLNPTVFAFQTIGTPQPSAPLTGQALVPNNPGFLGLRIGWQSIALVGSTLEASNPSGALVR